MPATVALVHCTSYETQTLERAIEQVLAPWGGVAGLVRRGDRVLLKPNFVVARSASAAVNTHPAVIATLARLCLDCGARVTVADSPAVVPAGWASRALGLDALLRPLGVPVVNLSRSRRVRIRLPHSRCTIHLAADVLETDALINLPKVKVHCQLVLTLAVKNLYGLVVARRKALLHTWLGSDPDRFATMLVELAQRVSPRLSLVDGVIGLEENGPTSGTPRPFSLLCAGCDPVAVDRVLVDVLGVAPEMVPTLRSARRLGVGCTDLAQIDVTGDPVDAFRISDLRLARPFPIDFTFLHLVRGAVRYFLAQFGLRRQPPAPVDPA